MVCHNNVGCSPLAAAVLAKEVGSKHVRSGGMGAQCLNKLAIKKARDYGARHGYDISNHHAVMVLPEDIAWADVVLYMDKGNLRRLMQMAPEHTEKFHSLARFVHEDRLIDPAFIPAGKLLDEMLDMVVLAVKNVLSRSKVAK